MNIVINAEEGLNISLQSSVSMSVSTTLTPPLSPFVFPVYQMISNGGSESEVLLVLLYCSLNRGKISTTAQVGFHNFDEMSATQT